ncbi:MAG: hypothetical protein ACOY90_12005 [Candidatus Zhuqueibacterota bacterium]
MKSFSKIATLAVLVLLTAFSENQAQIADALSKKLDNSFNRLEFTRDLQVSFSDKSVEQEISNADILLRRARRQLQNNRPVLANRSLNEANDLINVALRKLLKEPLRKQQQDLDSLIETAKLIVPDSQNPKAKNQLKIGIESRDAAHRYYRQNEFQIALKQISQAFFQVQKAIDMVKNSDHATKVKVEEEKAVFERLLKQTEGKISTSTHSTVKNNYRQAIKLTGKAEAAQANHEFQQAIEYYHQATRLLLRALDLAEGNGDRTAVRAHEEVAALDELIENFQNRVREDQQDDRFAYLGTRILQLQQDAHVALENKNYKLALMNAQLARDLIQRLVNNAQSPRGDADEFLQDEFDQLGVDIEEIKNRANQAGHTEALVLLGYGEVARQRGEQFLQNRNLRLARESILTANRFVFAADGLLRNERSDPPAEADVRQKIQSVTSDFESIRDDVKNSLKPELRVHVQQALKLLNLAQENMSQKYYYVADECADQARTLFEKCQVLLDK